MKLVINLDDVETWDDETVAKRIRDEIEMEISRYVKTLVKDALKEHESTMRKMVKIAAERDWRRVAKALEVLQGATT